MISIDEIVSRFQKEATSIENDVPNTSWYLFGSVLVDAFKAADIDLLIVCANHRSATLLRQKLASLCLNLPVHLLLMTIEEERELNFIQASFGQKIYPVKCKHDTDIPAIFEAQWKEFYVE